MVGGRLVSRIAKMHQRPTRRVNETHVADVRLKCKSVQLQKFPLGVYFYNNIIFLNIKNINIFLLYPYDFRL